MSGKRDLFSDTTAYAAALTATFEFNVNEWHEIKESGEDCAAITARPKMWVSFSSSQSAWAKSLKGG